MSEMVTVGKITKAHGIRGDVMVHPLTYDENRFTKLSRVFLNDSKQTVLTLERVRFTNKGIVVKFKESVDRNFAESIVKKELLIPEEERIELPDDVYFFDELVGCEVFGENNRRIGKIVEILQNPANDIYVVHDESGKENLIPAISEFVLHIDTEKKTIQIKEIPGLIS